jgi:hypothetical protein
MKSKLPLIAALVFALTAGVLGWKWQAALNALNALQARYDALAKTHQADLDRLAELEKKAGIYAESIAKLQAGRTDAETAPSTNQATTARQWMNNPQNQQRMQEWAMRGIDRQYGDWFNSLGLPPEQLEKLKALMATAQGKGFDLGRQIMNANGDTNAIAQAIAAYQAQRTTDQAALQALLGDKYQSLATFESTKPTMDAVERIQRELATGAAPLLPDQSRQLYALMQKAAANGATFSGGGGGRGGGGPGRMMGGFTTSDSSNPLTSGDPVATIQQKLTTQTQVNQQILTDAAQFLNPEQIIGLRQQLNNQVESLQRSMDWTKRMLSGEANADGRGGPPPVNF